MKLQHKIILALIAVIISITAAAPDIWAQGVQRFANIVARQLTVENAATFQDGFTAGGASTISTGGLTITAGGATITDGGLTVTDDGITISDDNIVIADFAQITAQTAISVTDGGIITPTGSYQPLESAAEVTATLSSGCTAGRKLALINTVATTINISETATSALSGNFAMGQYDSMLLWCDGTRWVQLAETDN